MIARPATRLRRTVRLAAAHRVALYAVGGGSWLSGGLWLLVHHFGRREGEFGVTAHPLESWSLAVHGAFAVAAIWTLGLLWGTHVAPGWSLRRRRRSGVALVVAAAWLVLSGYLLYYLGAERPRAVVSVAHWAAGLASVALFVGHGLRARIGYPWRP